MGATLQIDAVAGDTPVWVWNGAGTVVVVLGMTSVGFLSFGHW